MSRTLHVCLLAAAGARAVVASTVLDALGKAVSDFFHNVQSSLQAASSDGAQAFTTTEDGASSLSPAVAPQKGALQNPQWKLTVDDTASGQRQEVDGFGAAWTGATVQVFNDLPSNLQSDVMQDLFGEGGIRLGLMRHTIGQSDLTPGWWGRWSYDENGAKPDDKNLSHFDLTDHGRGMTGWIKKMLEVKPDVTLFGSPWSPPNWMKQDNTLQWQYVDHWVKYMVKYVQAFKDAGIMVHAVTLQNEPLHSGDPAWTTKIDQSYAAILTNELKPAFVAAGLQTDIWAYDHNTDAADYPEYVLQNAGANVGAVAWHCYSGTSGWDVLSTFHQKHPDKKQYMTECWTHEPGSSFFDLPNFVTGPLQNFASGALAWTLGGSAKFDVSYPGGCAPCSGIIQVDRDSHTYQKTRDFYTLGQFSKFVAKGAHFLTGTGSYTYPDGTGVQATQFKNPDGSKVVVVVNEMHNSLSTQIDFASGEIWNAEIPGRSVTTWILPLAGAASAAEVPIGPEVVV